MSEEKTGTVKWFDARKRYGFIERDDGSEDVFVHASGLADPYAQTLVDGERVSFIVTQGPKGPNAQDVRRVS